MKFTIHNSRSVSCCTYRVLLIAISALTIILPLRQAFAQENPTDRITIKGNELTGKILRLDSSGIRFETIYGKGTIVASYSDIEQITSLMVFRFIKENGAEIRGSIYGKTDQHLLVGITKELVQKVAIDEIRSGVPEFEFDRSFLARLRYRYPYWRGSVDLFYNYEKGAVDKRKIELGINANRRQRPTRFLFNFRYAEEIETASGIPEITTKDEYTVSLLAEYDISRDFFLYALPAAERDIPRGIDRRIYPAAGLGYRFIETATSLLQAQVGIAYVDEEFTNFDDDAYLGAHLGVEARYTFKNDIVLNGRMYYYPSIEDLIDDWLFRGDLELTVPLYEFVAMKIRLTNVNDNNPSPNVGENKFTALIGLSLTFQ